MNLNAVRAEALFVSSLQQWERPTVDQVRDAVVRVIREWGAAGCAARVAQEFGDHPEHAVARMAWARRLVAEAYFGDEGYGAGADRAGRTRPEHADLSPSRASPSPRQTRPRRRARRTR
ncbi:hypothetical protein ACNTMW_17970 [Planosporangium sp. 12N6]|uniref:hypothetical protein n=1 Tax=Planosporangium spinosum TaxID=3402278 RepID=UPI003CE97429